MTNVDNPKFTVHADQEIRFWMSAPAATVNMAAPVSDALALMREHEIRRLPVIIDTGELRGMITQGDIRGADVLRAAGVDLLDIAVFLKNIRIYEVMSTDVVSVLPDTSIREAALLMLEHKIGGLPVVDEDNFVVGIITESDLFEALVHYLDLSDHDA